MGHDCSYSLIDLRMCVFLSYLFFLYYTPYTINMPMKSSTAIFLNNDLNKNYSNTEAGRYLKGVGVQN